jgi:putative DNA primase/helicase
MNQIGEAAIGRWKSILPAMGIASTYLTGKHGPCPICQEGKDRFRFADQDQKGTWFCTKCGAGDGVKLVMLKTGLDFREVAREIERLAGVAPAETAKRQRTEGEKSAAMNALWNAGKPLCGETAAFRYLHSRTALNAFSGDLRASQSMTYYGQSRSTHPGLLAKVRDRDGKPVNIHRTFLTLGGAKAPVEDPKRLMEGGLPAGSAIRLFPVAETMGIAEGLETALSAFVLHDVPTWAAVNDSRLQAWVPPAGCKRVIIFADHDRSFAGQAAAYTLAKRLTVEKFAVEIRLPPDAGTDWNDVLVATLGLARQETSKPASSIAR